MPDTLPCPPPGTESSIASDEAVAPPAFVSVKGLFSVWPASTEAGPSLAMVTMGTFSIVVTEFEVAYTLPLNPVPEATADAFSTEPSSEPSRSAYARSDSLAGLAPGTGTR